MDALTPLTPEAAERFMARLPYEQRFHVSIVGKHGGFQSVPILSAEEFVKVTAALRPVFASEVLGRWVAERLGDGELGEAVRTACEEVPVFMQAAPAYELMSARLDEARAVLGVEQQVAVEA